MDDWLRNMGDWNISRRRYFGLPLPFYPCACGHLNVVGSLDELRGRATAGLDQLQELHRPWIDEVTIRCDSCGEDVRRVTEVGDAWLDAGIVPFATLGWENDEWIEGGYATGASRGLSGADLPDHAYWEKWFPADWISEMREQIRLWFYSQSFMSVTLTGRSPYNAVLTYEKLRDEAGREMHRSWGNSIDAAEALDNMGADVMRWMFCEQVPSQNLKFGYGPANEIKRRLLTLWNSVSFLVTYANIEGFRPRYADLAGLEAELKPLDRWLVARTQQLLREAEQEYERYWTPGVVRAFDAFVDDLSNWYIRRSRRRFYSDDDAAFRTLWHAVAQASRAIAPVLPFLAEHLWQNLVAGPCEDAPRSVFLAPWPEAGEADERLLAEVAAVRRVVELGRQARSTSGIKLRQPLRRLVVEGAPSAEGHAEEIAEELRVKEVTFGDAKSFVRFRVKPDLRKLGPKLGSELPKVRSALEVFDFEQDDEGNFLVAGHTLSQDEVLIDKTGPAGAEWAHAQDDGVTVAVDTRLDPELELEGRVYDLIHLLNSMRKDAGLELTDRVRVTLPKPYAELEQHGDWIAREVLAVEIRFGDVDEPQLEQA
jgi:isoleucyl-tRNA synthetase